jgi:hypothetical protein
MISDWTAMQNSLQNSFSTPAEQEDTNSAYVGFATDYLTNNPSSTVGDAGAYALMKLFPNQINIFYASPNSTNYTPIDINSSTEFDFIQSVPC